MADTAAATVALRNLAEVTVLLNGRGGGVMPSFLYGSAPTWSVEFKTDSVLADPTDVVFRIYNEPDGFSEVKLYSLAEITKTSTGCYEIEYELVRGGTWTWRFEGTGVVPAVAEGSLWVNDSAFYP